MSKVLRRSGTALTNYLDVLGWRPDHVVMVGVGGHHEEVYVMREVWKDFELYAFEANPLIYKDLSKNPFPGMVFEYAVCDTTDLSVPLYYKSNWKDGSTLHGRPEDVDGSITRVRAVRLDKAPIPKLIGAVGLLWLDCEGSELSALQSGPRFIRDHVQVVNCEMTSRPRIAGWPSALDVHRWLTQAGFCQAWTHTIRPSIGQFDAVYLRREIFDPTLTCCMDAALRFSIPQAPVLSQP